MVLEKYRCKQIRVYIDKEPLPHSTVLCALFFFIYEKTLNPSLPLDPILQAMLANWVHRSFDFLPLY